MLEGLTSITPEYLKGKNLESGAVGMNPGARATVPLSKASSDIKCNVGQSPPASKMTFSHTY